MNSHGKLRDLNLQSLQCADKVGSALQTDELIAVGPDDDGPVFKVQKQLLLDASDYFEKVLSGGFQEASQRRIRLPGTDLETTKLLVWWLCRKSLPSFGDDIEAMYAQGMHATYADVEARLMPLVKLWVLGDQLIMPGLQNDVMKGLLEVLHHGSMSCDMFEKCYITASSSPHLRDLIIVEARYEYFSHGTIGDSDLDVLGKIPGFMADFVKGKDDEQSFFLDHARFMLQPKPQHSRTSQPLGGQSAF